MVTLKQIYRNSLAVLKRIDHRQRHFNLLVDKSDEERVCSYCHERFVGRYCPQCSMDSDRVKFTTKSVVLNILDAWGLGNRSMFRNVKELFWRPGYMMADYLRGRKQAYFPPVKMLFILCLFYGLLLGVLDVPYVENDLIDLSKFQDEDNVYAQLLGSRLLIFNTVYLWLKNHEAVKLILENIVLIMVAGRVFANSPRLGRMTRTENFFVQMFIDCQMLIVSIVYVLVTRQVEISGMFPYHLPTLLVMVLLVYDYRQLFGFTTLKTVWKVLELMVINFLMLFIVLFVSVALVIAFTVFLNWSTFSHLNV